MSNPNLQACPYCPGVARQYVVPRGLNVHISRVHRDVNGGQAPSTGEELGPGVGNDVEITKLAELKKNVRVLRHVPRGARNLAAGKLCGIIQDCLSNNELKDWFALLTFSFTALRVPEGANHGSLTSKVKENVGSCCLYFPAEVGLKTSSVYRTIEAKVHDGDLRGAVRLLFSDSTLAPANADTLEALVGKHPSPSRQLDFPPDPDLSSPFLTVTQEEVVGALGSFYNGSASGLDGLRPQHLKELTSLSAGDNGRKLLESLTRLCNFLLRGMVGLGLLLLGTRCDALFQSLLVVQSRKRWRNIFSHFRLALVRLWGVRQPFMRCVLLLWLRKMFLVCF
ncbi:uncharacterized protein LOC134666373 [Cydia fagiglandana]|uniref:uncharacterized protein LOC134666373 n=1 Tax=Cydia fagiglandana TaxID=1458189 RepID=UPI002FEE2E22